nr:uncharacterized mitochondrial protein AtMg00810-like [Tanacetum cinerariifolium]
MAYSYSDYDGASLDRKSTTRGCQFLRCRFISWQCKKQTVVATSSTKAKYVAAASCCAQVLWIQNQLLDYGHILLDCIFLGFGLTMQVVLSVCACARIQVTPKASHLHAVKGIFRYLKGKPHLGLWYPKDSPSDLMAYSYSDYDGASLDRKSTTRGCQFLRCRFISWQCKKQTVVATSSTKAKYVAAASCCKFDGKVDEGFLVGYSDSSKAFRVFSSRTRIIQETLHINFLENKSNVAGRGPTWLFDIDNLTKAMNYQPVTAGNQSNPSVDAAFDEKEPEFEGRKPESEVNVSPSSSAQSKKHDDKTKREAKGKSPVESLTRYRNLSAEFEDFSDSSINEDNAIGIVVPAVEKLSPNSTNTFSAAGPSNVAAKDITYSDDEDDVGARADFTNLETTITVSPIPTTRVHKDHLVPQIIGDLSLATQTQSMTRVAKDQGTKWVFRNKKDERGIVVRNRARLVSQGHTQEEGIDYEEAFTPVERIEAIRSMIGSLMYLTSSRLDIMFAVCACARFQVTPKSSHIHAVKRIFRYLKGKPHLGLWYPKDLPFNLVAYSDSNYAGASLDRKSTTGDANFLDAD